MSDPARESDLARLGHIRHDLRTPINAILGYSEMLLEEAEDAEDLAAGLQEVNLLGRQMNEQINRALDNSALANHMLADLVDRAAAVLAPLADQVIQRCRSLNEMLRQHGKQNLAADLENILLAAGKFQELLGKVEQISGPVEQVSNLLNRGATETLSHFPEEESTADLAGDFDNWDERSGHILIVDDNKFNRDILARGLIRQKHHFSLAGHGKQALDMLAHGSFDLVLLDIMMPEMDGFETLARIKADDKLKHIPVIMISAVDQIDSVVRCIEMGAEDYLPKPFDPVLLKARVGACLEKKRLRDHELEYLRNVAEVTSAASALESGNFNADRLSEVGKRGDALGQLARVFESMAREVQAREQRLQMQVQKLKVEIDETRKAKQVAEITESDYFLDLQRRAQQLKQRQKPV